jgi:hypothetical protein
MWATVLASSSGVLLLLFVWALPTGAGDGSRTRDNQLGRLELYQLSYSREFLILLCDVIDDSVG